MINAEVISIGDELLAGYTINTNAAFISKELRSIGVAVKWVTTISDSAEEIENALKTANQRAKVITITGGLGPTPDDITKATICSYFNTKLVESPAVIEDIKSFLKARGIEENRIEKNRAQALVAENAIIISNKHGTAPGMILKQSNSIFCFMPGVPYEMKAMVSNFFLDFLKSKLHLPYIETRIFRTTGIAEAILHEQIKDILDLYPVYPVSYLPKPIGVDLRFKQTFTKEDSRKDWLTFMEQVNSKLKNFIFTEDERNIEQVVFDLLSSKNLTLSIAESFSGGLLQDWITNVAGSSKVYKGGVVCYSNESKVSLLNISSSTLEKYGAVSELVAMEMAVGIQKNFRTNCSIATTGIAGPGGGSEEKPVGLCFVSVCYNDKQIVKKFRFSDNREINKMRGAMAGLDLLRRLILDQLNWFISKK